MGSYNAMEKTAAAILWMTSADKYSFRYAIMLSDGDSSTYKHLCGLKVCGEGVDITKKECVNHMAKRMGTALRNLAKGTKKNGGDSRWTWAWKTHPGHQQTDIVLWQGHPQLHGKKEGQEEYSLFLAVSTSEEPHDNRYPTGTRGCLYKYTVGSFSISK